MKNVQKFFFGDLVRIRADMPSYKSHFSCDQDAIVLYIYAERYDGDDVKQFGVFLLKEGYECSWYDEDDLTLIEPDRLDKLPLKSRYGKSFAAKRARDLKIVA